MGQFIDRVVIKETEEETFAFKLRLPEERFTGNCFIAEVQVSARGGHFTKEVYERCWAREEFTVKKWKRFISDFVRKGPDWRDRYITYKEE